MRGIIARRMKRAGFSIRTAAAAIDALALYVILYATEYVAWEWVDGVDGELTEAQVMRAELLLNAGLLAIAVAYTGLEMAMAATPGKLLLGLRIANFDGSAPPRSRLVLRWLTKYQPLIFGGFNLATGIQAYGYLVSLTFWIVFIGCLWAMRESRLAWHDEWAWTSIVRVRPVRAR